MRSLTMNLSLAVAATFGLAAFSGAVRAADMPVEYPPVIEAPEPMPLPAVGGWYLRGDIGYKYYQAPKGVLSDRTWGSFGNNGEFGSEKMQGAADFGAGVGYKFNDYLRADLTVDYETPAKFKGQAYCTLAGPCGGGEWESSESAKITAYSALANVYADLGDFHGLKPYLGAGAGASYLKTSDVKSSAQDAFSGNYPAGKGKWNFAWALMAGVEYPLSDRLSLDLGYRYLNLGDAQTGSVTANPGGAVTHINYEDIQAHEVRLGLRYYLN
ncbi:outer membrane protein [Pleomorphomonas oryzae]|uniref:outer membrane protein n=1 Tax=Pleomorphomonas oryzae TaxID=261934 RepID=UPI0004272BA5|nr:outer membrane protein [Pleomorphomonas oryzae]